MREGAPPPRADDTHPHFDEREITVVSSFGVRRDVAAGEVLFDVGDRGVGLVAILSGRLGLRQEDGAGRSELVAEHGAGAVVGEVNSLSGRPALVRARLERAGTVAILTPEQVRALIVAEVGLGERITRALILRRVALLERGAGGPLIIGPAEDPARVSLAEFLRRNGLPFTLLDPAADEVAADLVRTSGVSGRPLVILADGTTLEAPGEADLARAMGLVDAASDDREYDLAIVGAGPGGLAAAVYAASEGLSVLVLDARGFGGQAGASARIENYFGFPTGVTGHALAARGFVQAQKFGAEIAIPAAVRALDPGRAGEGHRLAIDDGRVYGARAVVAASGARYRRPALPNLAEFEGRGVWYWASPLDAKLCSRQEVALVGGGNSAGQAAVFLAEHASKVRMFVRGDGLAATMSRYLVDRIAANERIAVTTNTEVTILAGGTAGLERITWRDRGSGEETSAPIRNLFLFIGAEPATDWLKGSRVRLDPKGFVRTRSEGHATDEPGVFAIGDVRSGSAKRIGGAIGEGAAVVAEVHAYLASRPRGAGR